MLVVILLSLKMIYWQQFSVRPAQCDFSPGAAYGSVCSVLDRGNQMIAHDRAVQPAAQPRLVTRLGLAARLQLVNIKLKR